MTGNVNWLQEYLLRSVEKNLCTKIHCTTCGALDFRRGLLSALAGQESVPVPAVFDRDVATAIAHALVSVGPVDRADADFESAVRCILFDLWNVARSNLALDELERILDGSWSGRVLDAMKRHSEAIRSEQTARAEYQSPEGARKRREAKRRLKQQQHQQRLARKKERDRIWWEQRRKNDE